MLPLSQNILAILLVVGVQRRGAPVVGIARGLPLIQISHDELGDDYPEMREEVHLEDFFWTGSGDGPPEYLNKVHTGISKGKDVVVKTETVVATVYVDGNNEIDIPICLDCMPDDGGGGGGGGGWDLGGGNAAGIPSANSSATDRRYWLLTVMSGFYTHKDNPMLEERLARLYRLAFTRQQTKHLGINGSQKVSSATELPVDSSGLVHISPSATESDPALDVEVLDMTTGQREYKQKTNLRYPENSEWENSSEEMPTTPLPTAPATEVAHGSTEAPYEGNGAADAYATLIPWELIQQDGKVEKLTSFAALGEQRQPMLHPLLRRDNVRIVLHNVTQITESDVQKGTLGTVYDDEVNEKIEDRPVANQTELIYSVFVNGRPVLAITAANDMKLVSESEVSDAIGHDIIMKAEPYLREPQATPLAPATRSSAVGFFNSIQNNTALVVISSLAMLLLLLLLLALFLMGRTRKRDKSPEPNRNSGHNGLLTEAHSGQLTLSAGTALDTEHTTARSHDVGIQNFSFELGGDQQSERVARIHFPGPPGTAGSRRSSLTSTDNTSDSSVYCPINPPTADVQRMLDAKAATLFERHKRRHKQQHEYDRAEGRDEPAYAKVATEKKRHKTKRRYLSENRVGSLDTSPVQRSSGDEVITGSIEEDDGLQRSYEPLGRAEARNPHTMYHRNKLLHQKHVFTDKELGRGAKTPEAINKEIIRAAHSSERSSDSGSIGSFLSMASVKAFPKTTMPEPLNRVLEPVFVTYYDNIDTSGPPSSAKSHSQAMAERKPREGRRSSLTATTIATIEKFPSPKAPIKSRRVVSQSDNADPGVVGPIVWERHKKHLSTSRGRTDSIDEDGVDDFRIMQYGPAAMRNHYEDLLEGAIQMYSAHNETPMLPTGNFRSNSYQPIKRELRGSSAGGISLINKRQFTGTTDGRPATAEPEKTHSTNQATELPLPTSGAWDSSLPNSHGSLLRPMSAGPFHRPEETMSKADSNRCIDVSAAPLIEAIQTELRKFKQHNV